MSSGLILLLIAIVLIVIVAYLAGVIIRKRNESLISSLDQRKQALLDLPVQEEIDAVQELHLIGQSQTTFREWSQKWSDVSKNIFPEIEAHTLEAESLNDTFNFIKAKHEIDNADSQLSLVEEDITAIREALSILKEQEEKNSARVTHALDLYEILQKNIEENEDNFGSTMPEIEKQLRNIEAEFSQFVTLNSTGDPMEASEVLDKAEEHTIALGQISEQIPAIVAKLEDDFPDQLDDLENGYRSLLEANYHFPEKDIEARFQGIRDDVRANSFELVTLDLDRAREENDSIQSKIDTLYQLFEREIEAQKVAHRDSKRLPKFLAHAEDNVKKLEKEIRRLTIRYIIAENHHLSIRPFERELETIRRDVLPYVESFDKAEKPFSELQVLFDKALQKLSDLEEEQMDLYHEIRDLEKIEVVARRNVDDYINRLHVIKRFMEKRHLPGIPQDFMSLFFTTSSQLEALMDELGRDRIDIMAVNRLSEVATNAIHHLESSAYQVVQDAVLTEQLLQYSNRYRSFEPSIQQSFENALKLFEVDNNYAASFDEISTALEIVEPGVTERFVSSYEKTREQILF